MREREEKSEEGSGWRVMKLDTGASRPLCDVQVDRIDLARASTPPVEKDHRHLCLRSVLTSPTHRGLSLRFERASCSIAFVERPSRCPL